MPTRGLTHTVRCSDAVLVDAGWPTDGGSAARARHSPFLGPGKPGVVWARRIRTVTHAISIDGAGTAYITANDGVYAIDHDGHDLWTYTASPDVLVAPVVTAGGRVLADLWSDVYEYKLTDFDRSRVVGLDGCGRVAWTFLALSQSGAWPAVAPDGTLYLSAHDGRSASPEMLQAVRDGVVLWKLPIGEHDSVTAPIALASDGTIHLATVTGRVLAVTPAGSVKWAIAVSQSSTPLLSLAVRSDDGLLVVDGQRLVALDRDGKTQWAVQPRTRGLAAPALGADDTAYVGGSNALFAYGRDGALLWRRDLPGDVTGTIVARDGTIYVAVATSSVGRLYALAPSGEPRWMLYIEPTYAFAIASDGLLYALAADRLYAIGTCKHDPCGDDASAVATLDEPAPAPDVTTKVDARATPRAKPPPGDPHAGYTIHRGCPRAALAIVSEHGAPLPWYASAGSDRTVKSIAAREEFRSRAAAAAGIRSHATGFGLSCVDPRGAFAIFVTPDQPLDDAARRLGEWLVAQGLSGEIDLVVSARLQLDKVQLDKARLPPRER
jgi:hypothetical protein